MIYIEDLLAENKRISVRKAYKITSSYSIQSHIYSDNIADISKSGLFIETVRSFNIGEEIIISFNMHGYARPFKIKGSIVCSNRQGIGVQYKDVKPYIVERLGALVDRMKRETRSVFNRPFKKYADNCYIPNLLAPLKIL